MNNEPQIPAAQRERSFLSKLFQAVFILVLLAAVSGCDFYAMQVWRQLRSTHNWPDATAVVRKFQSHRGGWNRDKIQYVLDVTYRYTVNDATFVATNQLPEIFLSSFEADRAAESLRAKGSYLPIFYNPNDPADCVLSRDYPRGVLTCFGILSLATMLAFVWFGRRLVRLAAGEEDVVPVRPVESSDDDLGAPVGLGQRTLRWFVALLGAASCWWMALTIYRNWSLPPAERTLPPAHLILVMEFILAHSGVMVSGMLSTQNQTRQSKIKAMLFLGLIYLTFATAIAAAAHSFRLFMLFSGIMISRWVALMLDSNKARQQQMMRSMETFVIFFVSLIVFLVVMRLSLDVVLIAYFCLIGLFEGTLPLRRKSWFKPAIAQ